MENLCSTHPRIIICTRLERDWSLVCSVTIYGLVSWCQLTTISAIAEEVIDGITIVFSCLINVFAMAVFGINSKEHQKVEGVDDDKEEEYNICGDESPFLAISS